MEIIFLSCLSQCRPNGCAHSGWVRGLFQCERHWGVHFGLFSGGNLSSLWFLVTGRCPHRRKWPSSQIRWRHNGSDLKSPGLLQFMAGQVGHQSGQRSWCACLVQAAMFNGYRLLLHSMSISLLFFLPRLEATLFGKLWDVIVWPDAEVCPGRIKPFTVDHGGGGSDGCFPASCNELDICASTTGPREECETPGHNLAHISDLCFWFVNHLLIHQSGPTAIRHQSAGRPQENRDVVAAKGLEHRDFARIPIQIDESNWIE